MNNRYHIYTDPDGKQRATQDFIKAMEYISAEAVKYMIACPVQFKKR